MKTLSIGKYRGMQRCSTATGELVILAMDHRNNLRNSLKSGRSEAVTDEDLTTFKDLVIRSLGNLASAVLLDPQYGAAQLIVRSSLPKAAGLIVALEATGYTGRTDERYSQVLPEWTAAKARRMGADAVKLLVYYNPEADSAPAIESLVDSVAQECASLDVLFFLESLSYTNDPSLPKFSPEKRREVILESARILTAIKGVDVLKVEFPVDVFVCPDEKIWETGCYDLSRASKVPWVLLSGAVEFDTFLRMSEIACRQGASGVAAGRAVWQEAPSQPEDEREVFLQNICRSRLEKLAATCGNSALSWQEFYIPPDISPEWYKTYSGFNNHG